MDSTQSSTTLTSSNIPCRGDNNSVTNTNTISSGRSLGESLLLLNDEDGVNEKHKNQGDHLSNNASTNDVKCKKRDINQITKNEEQSEIQMKEKERKNKQILKKYMSEMIPFLYPPACATTKTTTSADNTITVTANNSTPDEDKKNNSDLALSSYQQQLQKLQNENKEIIQRKQDYIERYTHLVTKYEYGLSSVKKLNDLTYAPDNILNNSDD